MANTNKDELEARRWFRQRLAELAQQYPQLQEPENQKRLAEALPQLLEELCPMPRQPTGRPTGRPPGSGHLAAPRRITVWLPGDIYEKLTIYAEGRRGTRGGHPQLARCVREAIEHYLTCPDKRQTGSVPQTVLAHNGQTIIVPEPEHTARQPPLDKAALVARLRQMRAGGMTLQRITDQLRAEGTPTLSGTGSWHASTVHGLVG